MAKKPANIHDHPSTDDLAELLPAPVSAEVDPILTLSDAGRFCGKSHTTIRSWINDGLLTHVRHPSGLPGVRLSELRKFYGNSALPLKATGNGKQ